MENNQSNNKNVSLSLIAEYGGSDSEPDEADDQIKNVNEDSDVPELSEMVLKNNIINACAHGPMAKRPDCEDDEGSVRTMIIDPEVEDIEYQVTMYREDDSDSDSTSSSNNDSDIDSVKDIEEISSGDEETNTNKAAKLEAPKVNGELGLEDLPPIEDLAISLPAKETCKIGTVASIIEQLVIVKANPGTPAVDLDSVLFLDNGAKALGKVFDVFGPVKEPHYAVRFNSAAHAASRGVAVGADVFIAPESQHTSFVFLPDLMKIKGSDASWKNDLEPPPTHVEYSDDEEERRARREAKRHDPDDGENSKNRGVKPRNNRPSESSSRFGSGPSRGRNPFSAGTRRNLPFPRYHTARPFLDAATRTPPQHPMDPNVQFGRPPSFPIFPPSFNPRPPFMYHYPSMGGMGGPMPVPNNTYGASYCTMTQPQWVNTDPPPPPGT